VRIVRLYLDGEGFCRNDSTTWVTVGRVCRLGKEPYTKGDKMTLRKYGSADGRVTGIEGGSAPGVIRDEAAMMPRATRNELLDQLFGRDRITRPAGHRTCAPVSDQGLAAEKAPDDAGANE
jgi:hypothetical protein